jgi:type IV secretion system protein VirD4
MTLPHLELLAPLGVITLGLVTALRQFDPTPPDGFATRQELKRHLGLAAARQSAKTTRPQLDKHAGQHELGYPLGRSVRPKGKTLLGTWEHSLELVAPPASGKTLRVLAPILRQHPGPVLATSTKPDLYEVSAIARARIGPVVALDPEALCPAAIPLRWSPIVGCEDPTVAERRANALVAAASDTRDVRAGAFFRRSAATVLSCYLHAAALEGWTMREVLAWAGNVHDPAPLRILANRAQAAIDWSARLHAHTSGAEETTSGVLRTLDLALGCFANPSVLAQVSVSNEDSLDAVSLLEDNATIFALGKARDGGAAPLVTAFCDEFLFTAEAHAATKAWRRLDPPLLCCLDEAPSIAPLPDLPALLADARGRGIVVVFAMQSFSQAEDRWGPRGAETLRNAASTLAVFGGLSVSKDLEELSRLCGTRKVQHLTHSRDGQRRASSTTTLHDEAVLTVAEIRRLKPGQALLLANHLAPVVSYFPGVWEGKDAALIAAEERTTQEQNDHTRKEHDDHVTLPR